MPGRQALSGPKDWLEWPFSTLGGHKVKGREFSRPFTFTSSPLSPQGDGGSCDVQTWFAAVQRELMKLFALDLQPAEALLQYRRCADVLRTELGIEPMPETQTLFRHLLQGSGGPPAPPRPAFVAPQGREEHQLKSLLQRLDRALQSFEALRNELAQAIEGL